MGRSRGPASPQEGPGSLGRRGDNFQTLLQSPPPHLLNAKPAGLRSPGPLCLGCLHPGGLGCTSGARTRGRSCGAVSSLLSPQREEGAHPGHRPQPHPVQLESAPSSTPSSYKLPLPAAQGMPALSGGDGGFLQAPAKVVGGSRGVPRPLPGWATEPRRTRREDTAEGHLPAVSPDVPAVSDPNSDTPGTRNLRSQRGGGPGRTEREA